uniref:Mediator of RNA polymerase II transcription subunit 16 n=3 Tax=Scheffersomyces stipitis (strain ATCC 58785 / CBS 6054 / NBRC 10063 / NRRL Y-11545) TaxID=322104 RepID=MED16_PICST|nr:RecName: Full=Mediator of RNA polymerase II transcription subunit 16; AltName: Full=Mediator complex subunit 16 [Scheffersomyces stipitis CBS 6054]
MARTASGATRPSDLISWSRNGFIAYACPVQHSKDNLLLTYLENVNGNSWKLAEPQSISVKLENNFLSELALVEWSYLSTDLAISDVYGNFYILLAGIGLLEPGSEKSTVNSDSSGAASTAAASQNSPSYELTSYNHMEMIYRDIINQDPALPVNPGAAIVSFSWLNIEKVQIINKPAALVTLENQNSSNSPFVYTYGVNQFQPHGVTHPISTKQACVALRQNGQFTLYFQGEHKVEYHKTSVALSDDIVIITKASIGFTNDKQIVVTAYDSVTRNISTYSVTVDWGFLVESAKRQKVDPHYHTPKEEHKTPKLNVTRISASIPVPTFLAAAEEEGMDMDKMDVDADSEDGNQPSYQIGSLASIDIISAGAEKDSSLDILISYTFEDGSGIASSTIYRYSLSEESELISSAFGELGVRKNVTAPANSPTVQTVTLQDKLIRSGTIQSITTALSDYFILLYYLDGHVDVVDRNSMKIVNNSDDTNLPPKTISSIFDVGFNFPKIDNSSNLIMAVSPNLTSVAYADFKGGSTRLNLKVFEKEKYLGISPKELFATSVGFAFRHAYACYTNTCSDDLVALIQTEIVRLQISLQKTITDKPHNIEMIIKKFVESIVSESHKAINFQLDAFNKESVDKLLSNPPLQKLLSLQLVLGELQDKNSIVSDIAWIVLNLRSTSFGIMFSLSSIYRQISKKKPTEDSLQDSITRGECIMSLVGNVKWLIDLMVYINQELLQLSYSKQDSSNSKLTIKNSIALPIILSKVPRLFLMYALSSIGRTHEILKKLHKDLSEASKLFTPMKESLNRYFTICNNSPLTLSLFENFLRECDALITKEQSIRLAGKEKGYSLKVEQKLVCQGELTEDMEQIGKILIDRHAVNINRDMKVSDLYFYDVDWLDIGVNKRSARTSKGLSETVIYPSSQLKPKMIPRLQYSDKECIDSLRKIIISVDMNQITGKTDTSRNGTTNHKAAIANDKIAKLRKCTRCRSVSLVADPLVFDAPSTIGLWTMVFQRTCICGNAWVNCVS